MIQTSTPDTALADFPPRQIDFAFDPAAVPVDWFRGDPQLTAVLNALSILFPDGESFFVESVRACREGVTDEKLSAEVAAFILQEAMHGRGHRVFNDLLRAQGQTVVDRLEKKVRALLGFGRRRLFPTARLGITCGLEHFTSLLGEELLRNEEFRNCIHPSVRGLWLWHALEETEHKAVAFDVYEAAEGGYPVRIATMLIASFFLVTVAARNTRTLAADRGRPFAPRSFAKTMKFLWGSPGIFRKLVPDYLRYYRPGFHPDQRDTRELVRKSREALFGAGGLLESRAKIIPARASAGVPFSAGAVATPALA